METKERVQRAFIKYYILDIQLKSLLESEDEMGEIYEAFEDKSEAREFFEQAIKEVQDSVTEKYGMTAGSKKEHEILAEQLDKVYGKNHTGIDNNVNRLIEKTSKGSTETRGITGDQSHYPGSD